jgi:hypothetical protein
MVAALGLALGLSIAPAHAATVTTYNDAAAFLAAIGTAGARFNADGLLSGTAITGQAPGIGFSSANDDSAGALSIRALASPGAASPPNLIAGGYIPGSPNTPESMVLTFSPWVTAYGASLSPLTPDSLMVAFAVDFKDNTTQTFGLRLGNNKTIFFGVRSDTGIVRIRTIASKNNGGGQDGFKNFGIDNLAWVSADTASPICSAVKAIEAGVLGFDGTSSDVAVGDTGIASVGLAGGSNVTLTCHSPFPAACGSLGSPTGTASWRLAPTLPGLDGSGTVVATDAAGHTCSFEAKFTAFEGGAPDDLLVCQDDGVILLVSNGTAATPGQIVCSSTPPGPGEPPYPPGYEPSPASDPFPCTVFTIKSPISGSTTMILKKDGTFDPRLRMLFSHFDGVAFPPFTDVTQSVEPIDQIIPDPTRVQGSGQWSQVKVACAIQAELCNGLDDDGDGQIDEGLPTDGPAVDCDGDGYPLCPTTATTAIDCAGHSVTLVPGGAPDCNDQIGAIHAGAAELCNGLDDNCNGQIDEGNPAGGAACIVPGLLGPCAQGVTSCADGPMRCVQTVFPAAETCNGVDDDCDGTVDEGNPPGGASCTIPGALGRCAAGVTSCATGSLACAPTWTPAAETCNGLDDDCDGSTDEGLGTLSCGVGACARTVPACTGGVPQTCVPGNPGTEVCNGVDDDCDGAIDEGLGTVSCGVGVCARTVDACAGGVPQACTPGAAGTEVCNGLDDDCDGVVDDGLGTVSCGLGICARTVPACAAGVPQACVPGPAGIEVCNGLDDDCDGLIDEAFVFSGFQPPVINDGSGIYQAKSTIPFKFRLSTCAGATPAPVTATIEVIPYAGTIVGTVDVGPLPALKADTGTVYAYDAKGNQYIFNLGTKNLAAGAAYLVRTRVSDGSVHDVVISLK